MGSILCVDDDSMFCELVSDLMLKLGHHVDVASNLRDCRAKSTGGPYEAVLLDVGLPDGSGLNMIPEIRSWRGSPEVIIVTGGGNPDGAELAIKSGAWDYFQKTASIQEMSLSLNRALEYHREKASRKSPFVLKRENIVGNSQALKACLDQVAQAALSDAAVLITGETGTGKELFAQAIHNNSPRAEGPFVVVDCTTLPENLVESTLFGHERGAYTGADSRHLGLIKQADGGTLFLDEVGDLPFSIQKAFLRLLQEKTFRPVGGSREIRSDFRLIAATNRDLDSCAAEGSFRHDLLFRLRSFEIHLPSLRERPEDIIQTVLLYLVRLCQRYDMPLKGISPEVLEIMQLYEWPGNVRELVQVMERTLAVARRDPTIYPVHLPVDIRIEVARHVVGPKEAPAVQEDTSLQLLHSLADLPPLKEYREAGAHEYEKRYLKELLALAGSDVDRACATAGLSRSHFYALLRKHNIAFRS